MTEYQEARLKEIEEYFKDELDDVIAPCSRQEMRDMFWLISEVKKGWERESKMREALLFAQKWALDRVPKLRPYDLIDRIAEGLGEKE